jgi:hypothetical protein
VQVLLTLKIQVRLIHLNMPKKKKRKKQKAMHLTKRILLCMKMTSILDSNNNNSSLTPLSVDHLRGHQIMIGDQDSQEPGMAMSPSMTFNVRCQL